MSGKRGRFYGVSVGPGDPELLTLKAVRILERCPVIAAPSTGDGRMLALSIAEGAVDLSGKTILPLFLTMTRDRAARLAEYRAAAEQVAAALEGGRDVAMVNLGDVSVYATYPYLMELLRERGYGTEMIPGVPSFCAAASRLGVSLTEGNESLHLLSGREPLDGALELDGTKVLMKTGRQLPQVLEALRVRGLLEQSVLVENCGLPGERVCRDLSRLESEAGYFTLIIVKE